MVTWRGYFGVYDELLQPSKNEGFECGCCVLLLLKKGTRTQQVKSRKGKDLYYKNKAYAEQYYGWRMGYLW